MDATLEQQRAAEARMEQIVGRLLQTGVLLAAAVVVVGAVLVLARHGAEHADFHRFHLQRSDLRSLSGIFAGAFAFDPRSIVQLGLVLLILTPAARVALTLVAFVLQRDRTYTLVTIIVLAILLYGLVWGAA